MMEAEVELITDYPASIADMLINNYVDIALVPVAIIPLLNEHHIITDYCIGANGNVASVCLFSDVPLHQIRCILLDYQSKSSVGLLKVLLKDFWKINVKLINGDKGYEDEIGGTTAGLVIGDRAFIQRKKHTYIYDLATAWNELTGLPFLFAAWIANKQLPVSFISKFNAATAEGFKFLPSIIAENAYPHYDLQEYYTKNISYDLDKKKLKGLEEYLKRLKTI